MFAAGLEEDHRFQANLQVRCLSQISKLLRSEPRSLSLASIRCGRSHPTYSAKDYQASPVADASSVRPVSP